MAKDLQKEDGKQKTIKAGNRSVSAVICET